MTCGCWPKAADYAFGSNPPYELVPIEGERQPSAQVVGPLSIFTAIRKARAAAAPIDFDQSSTAIGLDPRHRTNSCIISKVPQGGLLDVVGQQSARAI